MDKENESTIVFKKYLDKNDCDRIAALEKECAKYDEITLKLEIDYKLGVALSDAGKLRENEINEFLCFDGQLLIGYIGICSFGGTGVPLEITGMVHPAYRRGGIFTKLHELAVKECKRRNRSSVLLLCDRKSVSGHGFLKKIGAEYKYSEFEMRLMDEPYEVSQKLMLGISLRKATNSDALEVERQNAIFFDDSAEYTNSDAEDRASNLILPEDEEKRGMTIYLAERDKQVVGKVHLQISANVGGIYGLGVLPEHRNQGYGRAILLSAVKKLKESQTNSIMLQVAAGNATALNLYKSCGFRETSVMDYDCLDL